MTKFALHMIDERRARGERAIVAHGVVTQGSLEGLGHQTWVSRGIQ